MSGTLHRAVIILLITLGADVRAEPLAMPAPEFTATDARDWINTPPLRLAELRGNVLLIDFWTFSCWNCYRSFPWLNDLQTRFEDEALNIIGIHSPEFEHERERAEVARQAQQFGLRHPIMIDNDFAYWRAMKNRYWPAFYLVDKRGQLRYRFIGETHSGDARATEIERAIRELLAE